MSTDYDTPTGEANPFDEEPPFDPLSDEWALADTVRRMRITREARRILDGETVNLDKIPAPRTLRQSLIDPPPGEPIRIDKLCIVGGRTTIVGARKTGKTTFLGNLIRALLDGTDFLGRYPVRAPIAVVYVLSYEMSERQFTAWLADQGLAEYGDRIVIWHLRGQPNPLRSEKGRALVAEALAETGACALVVDTFGKAFYGRSQSDAAEVTQWLVDLDEVAGPHRDIYLSVHAGWVGERSRGSSALEDWPDTTLTIVDDDGTRYLSTIGRDVDDIDGLPLAYDPAARLLRIDEEAPTRRAAKSQRKSEERQAAEAAKEAEKRKERDELVVDLLAAMQAEPGLGVNALRNRVANGKRPSKVNEALALIRSWQLAKTEPAPGNKKPHYITDAGLAVLEAGELPTHREKDQQP
jgi:AAA domain